MQMDQNFLTYSALDSACTFEVHQGFWDDLKGYTPAYDMTMRILPSLMYMQTRGIKVSRKALDETKVEVLKTASEKQLELNALVGRELNVNSPKACQAYFYDELGIPPYRGPEGRPTVNDMALQKLVRGTVARPGLRQAKLVQDIRGLHKLYGTYLNLEFDTDDRLRCSYNPRGTKFGRLSSSKTIFGTGTNFQNLPQEFKKFLVADPGYCFLEADKRQAEWVVVAYCTGDANMIAAIEKGIDVHTHTASLMFDVDPDVVKFDHKLVGHETSADIIRELRTNDSILAKFVRTMPRSMSLRQCGKKSNHGLNYDEGINGFAMINEIDQAEARRIVNMYHKIYPGIRIWYEDVKRMLMKDRTLTNCFGRSVRFLGSWNDKLWKSAYSMLPQSTVVDSLNGGMEELYEDAWVCGKDGLNGDLLAQVHDSILMQFPISALREKEVFDKLLGKITVATSPSMTYAGRTFQIATDYKFGINWGGYNTTSNPGGMQDIHTHEDFLKALNEWEMLSGAGTSGMA